MDIGALPAPVMDTWTNCPGRRSSSRPSGRPILRNLSRLVSLRRN